MHEEVVEKYIGVIDRRDFSDAVIAEALTELPLGDPSNPQRGDGPLNILMNKLIGGGHVTAGVPVPNIEAGEVVSEKVAARRRGLLELVARMTLGVSMNTPSTMRMDCEVCLLTLSRRLVEQNPLNRFTTERNGAGAKSDVDALIEDAYEVSAIPAVGQLLLHLSAEGGKDPINTLERLSGRIQEMLGSNPEKFSEKAKALVGYEATQIGALREGAIKTYLKLDGEIFTAEAAGVADTLEVAFKRQEAVRFAMQAKMPNADEVAAKHYPAAVEIFAREGAANGLSNVRDRLHVLENSTRPEYPALGAQLRERITAVLQTPAGVDGLGGL